MERLIVKGPYLKFKSTLMFPLVAKEFGKVIMRDRMSFDSFYGHWCGQSEVYVMVL